MTPARKDRLTRETDTRSFPARCAKISSRQSKLRLSAETIVPKLLCSVGKDYKVVVCEEVEMNILGVDYIIVCRVMAGVVA